MHFSPLLLCVLVKFAAAAPVEMVPVAPLITLYHDAEWVGQQFDARSLRTCVKVDGPLHGHVQSAKLWPNSPPSRLCALFESDDCRPGTEVIFIRAENSKVNIRHNGNVRSVYCLGAQRMSARF